MSLREGFGIVLLLVGLLFLTHGLVHLALWDGGKTVVVFAATTAAGTLMTLAGADYIGLLRELRRSRRAG